jgi:hypothetical protein
MKKKAESQDLVPGKPYYPDSYFSFDYPPERPVTCENCKWSGVWRETRTTDLSRLGYWIQVCPKCEEQLAIVQGWTPEEVLNEAARGNPNAIPLIGEANEKIESGARYASQLVLDPTAFPAPISDRKIVFIWDQEPYATGETGEYFGWNVIRMAVTGEEVCREPASYEVPERYKAIKALLELRYGNQFESLIPTSRSWMFLFGDNIGSISDCGVTRSATAEEAPWAE